MRNQSLQWRSFSDHETAETWLTSERPFSHMSNQYFPNTLLSVN
jgi:hypothetical protein